MFRHLLLSLCAALIVQAILSSGYIGVIRIMIAQKMLHSASDGILSIGALLIVRDYLKERFAAVSRMLESWSWPKRST